MLELKEAEINVKDILVYINHKQTAKKWLKDQGEIPTVTVHEVHINKTTSLHLPT